MQSRLNVTPTGTRAASTTRTTDELRYPQEATNAAAARYAAERAERLARKERVTPPIPATGAARLAQLVKERAIASERARQAAARAARLPATMANTPAATTPDQDAA